MSLLFYRRPNYVDRMARPMDPVEYERFLEKTRKAIPPELSFEMVVANRAMPPCSLQDFMGYLTNVSHDSENLQFYLWLHDYRRRFFLAPRNEQALSPPWNEDLMTRPIPPTIDVGPGQSQKAMAQMLDLKIDLDGNQARREATLEETGSILSGSQHGIARSADEANQQAGLKWQSFTIQPFRAEIDRVISHYLTPGAPRELNLSYKDRAACLHALQHTTHPSALQIPEMSAVSALRDLSHPNFIRWSTANGNRPRVLFGRVLGALNILLGFLVAILLLLSTASRWWRIFALPLWFLGFAFLLAGANGVCLVLYVTSDRHMRPWEQYNDDASISSSSTLTGEKSTMSSKHGFEFRDMDADQKTLTSDFDAISTKQTRSEDADHHDLNAAAAAAASFPQSPSPCPKREFKVGRDEKSGGKQASLRLEAFGTANAYGHEVWVDKYRAKMMIRKIFDKTVWVENEHVRIVQDKVAWQALLWATILSVPLTIVFVAVPSAHVYR